MNKLLLNIGAFTEEELDEKVSTKFSDYIFSAEEALRRNLVKEIVSSTVFDKKSECLGSSAPV